MSKKNVSGQLLSGENLSRSDIYQDWESDNQAWWDWYVSLAKNEAPQLMKNLKIETLKVDKQFWPKIFLELSEPYTVSAREVAYFQENGFIKIKNVLSGNAIYALRETLLMLLKESFDNVHKKPSFRSMELVWLRNKFVKEYVLSQRIAGIAGQLLKVKRLRLYYDNVLSKEPGCGRTPWHYDAHHFPLRTNNVVTAWIPAQPIILEMGPLAFATPISTYKLVESISFDKFSVSYDDAISECFKKNNVDIVNKPFDLGEISFHHNLSCHTAGRNNTNVSRVVLANTFYEDGTYIVENPTMVSGDWKKFFPGLEAGQLAKTDLNPICWERGKNV